MEALIEYMDLYVQGDSTLGARKALLERQRDAMQERVADMQAGLERLAYKIDNYESVIAAKEKELLR